jgi:hypothetical protein
MAGEHLDLSSDRHPPPAAALKVGATGESAADARRFLGIQFLCCDVYARVYLNRQQTAYSGHCPRCAKPVHIRVGPGGTNERFFVVR